MYTAHSHLCKTEITHDICHPYKQLNTRKIQGMATKIKMGVVHTGHEKILKMLAMSFTDYLKLKKSIKPNLYICNISYN